MRIPRFGLKIENKISPAWQLSPNPGKGGTGKAIQPHQVIDEATAPLRNILSDNVTLRFDQTANPHGWPGWVSSSDTKKHDQVVYQVSVKDPKTSQSRSSDKVPTTQELWTGQVYNPTSEENRLRVNVLNRQILHTAYDMCNLPAAGK